MHQTARIYVAGQDTLLGATLLDLLREQGYQNLAGVSESEPELTHAAAVEAFFASERPEYVFLAAGKSGGIRANQAFPATLMRDNLLVAAHVLDSAHRHGAVKLLYLASSCTYPRLAPQPLRVESLLTGPFEPTNEAYAVAKLAGLKLCQAYRQQHGFHCIAAIPANSFGPYDDFSAEDSHVIPGLIRRCHEARQSGQPELSIWGTGRARREFVYARDLADACLFVMQHYDGIEPINLGGGVELSIGETARAVADVVGYRGRLVFDASRPDGMPFKGLDSAPLLAMGWKPRIGFRASLAKTYDWFLRHAVREELEDACKAV